MATLEDRCLEAFPSWLRTLADDARALAFVLEAAAADAPARHAAAALDYLRRSLELVPDGLEDLGFMDDAFVLRALSAGLGPEAESVSTHDQRDQLARLAGEAELVREFLDTDYARLERFVHGLATASIRGRSAQGISSDDTLRAQLLVAIRQWADAYAPPSFSRDPRNLVKLRAFMLTKLPA